jgi:restriction system protein
LKVRRSEKGEKVQLKGGICEVNFGYNVKMGVYANLNSDILELYEIAPQLNKKIGEKIMSIWRYAFSFTDKQYVENAVGSSVCVFCHSPFRWLPSEFGYKPHPVNPEVSYRIARHVRFCEVCGWWVTSERRVIYDFEYHTESHQSSAAAGILLELDVSDQSIPLSEIRSYLAAKYDSRFEIPPQKFEEVVVSVFRDIGYSTQAVGRTGDGGIDAIFEGPSGTWTGIQVKRYRNKIKVEQIRALLGALVLKGYTRGMFVTTGEFQSGAFRTAEIAAKRGVPIELIDAPRFFEALKIAQREKYRSSADPTAPFFNAHMLSLDK